MDDAQDFIDMSEKQNEEEQKKEGEEGEKEGEEEEGEEGERNTAKDKEEQEYEKLDENDKSVQAEKRECFILSSFSPFSLSAAPSLLPPLYVITHTCWFPLCSSAESCEAPLDCTNERARGNVSKAHTYENCTS